MNNLAVTTEPLDAENSLLICSECGPLGPVPADTVAVPHGLHAAIEHVTQVHSINQIWNAT